MTEGTRGRDDAAAKELQQTSRHCDSVAAQISLHAYVSLCFSWDLKRESVVVLVYTNCALQLTTLRPRLAWQQTCQKSLQYTPRLQEGCL